MTAMLISVRLRNIPGRSGLLGYQVCVPKNVDSDPDREFVKNQTDVLEKMVILMIVGNRNVNGKSGKSGLNVLRSVGEVGETELGNVRKKTNVLELGLRRKIATKMTVSGQPGGMCYVFVKDTDLVQKRTGVRETEKKQFRIVT